MLAQIFVPGAVYKEITIIGKPGNDVLKITGFIHVKEIQNTLASSLLRSQLDQGEAEAIVLAREPEAELLILDEKKARKITRQIPGP